MPRNFVLDNVDVTKVVVVKGPSGFQVFCEYAVRAGTQTVFLKTKELEKPVLNARLGAVQSLFNAVARDISADEVD